MSASHSVLVGDIGGTNSRLAIARSVEGEWSIEQFWKTANDDHANFESVVSAYISQLDVPLPSRALFGAAGPVANNEVTLTNRPWSFSATRLEDQFGIARVDIVNDFVAMARSAPELSGSQIELIAPGKTKKGPIVVAGPGTGFGLATLSPFRDDWFILGGEGGHQAYAPVTPLEVDLANRLREKHGYVSNELVAAGVGYGAVLETLQEIFGVTQEYAPPSTLLKLAADKDELALSLCRIRAATIWSAAGDAVIAHDACGGLFLAGGVTERLIDYVREPSAMARFYERGPKSSFMEDIPVHLITCPEAPLIGAAAYKDHAR